VEGYEWSQPVLFFKYFLDIGPRGPSEQENATKTKSYE